VDRTLEQRLAGGQLPPRQPLGQGELEECTDDDCPQDRRSELAPGKARRRKVASSDPGRGHEKTGADERENRGLGSSFHLVAPETLYTVTTAGGPRVVVDSTPGDALALRPAPTLQLVQQQRSEREHCDL
jgi:hypothetical protein